jgi:integrase
MKAVLKTIDDYSNAQIKNLMLMALYTGMRRGELFKLKWKDINFERGFISIVDPKGGPDQRVPLNAAARSVLETHPRPQFKVKATKNKYIESPHVFPGRGGQQRVSCQASVNEIKENAGNRNQPLVGCLDLLETRRWRVSYRSSKCAPSVKKFPLAFVWINSHLNTFHKSLPSIFLGYLL